MRLEKVSKDFIEYCSARKISKVWGSKEYLKQNEEIANGVWTRKKRLWGKNRDDQRGSPMLEAKECQSGKGK